MPTLPLFLLLCSVVVVVVVTTTAQIIIDTSSPTPHRTPGACMNANTTYEQQQYFFQVNTMQNPNYSIFPAVDMFMCSGGQCPDCNKSTPLCERDMGNCLLGLPSPPCQPFVETKSPGLLPQACIDCTSAWADCIQQKCTQACFQSSKVYDHLESYGWISECECCNSNSGCRATFYQCAGFLFTDFIDLCPTMSPTSKPTPPTAPSSIPLTQATFTGIVNLNAPAQQDNSVVAGSVTGVLCGFTFLVIVIFAALEK
jgi:hypothetical protein